MDITLITGFLGAGKTTFLNRFIREYADGAELGVIVNDLSELEVDGELIRGGHKVSEEKGTLISLFNGSISSGRSTDFSEALRTMRGRGIGRLMIETSGGSHPAKVLEAIRATPGANLGAVVTLVDSRMILHDYDEGRTLIEAVLEGDRPTENLLADQVGAASVVVMTKIDLVPENSLRTIFRGMMALNPEAVFVACAYGKMDWKILSQAGPPAADLPVKAPRDLPEIVSRVVRDPRPLHPARFHELYRSKLGIGVYRSKGFIWFASRPDQVLLWNQAGGALGIELVAFWKVHMLEHDSRLLPEEKDHLRRLLAGQYPVFGDRNCELTLIGLEQDVRIFEAELLKCFCTPGEISTWRNGGTFADPWPSKLARL
ncbi:GTP-binding protein [Luteolibacter sp. SL250]|uniref:CobW family GTP-binding protein n=1 Tax=Luteolibacter sp. SL250 TaxID=2995170 RepID=UPI00226F2AD6|nr:GTP-binding protein [Luteolibacter sp. SL250]WAC21241.1 GTP-binding protein [Luteolibacter sp. SL250]